MTPETFRGPDLRAVLDAVRRAYGEEAMIVHTKGPKETGYGYEVAVAPLGQAPRRAHVPSPRGDRPTMIALVGPAGAGKSTAAAKLALHYSARRSRVCLLTLDDFKVGALEQMQLFAELTNVALDTIHAADEVPALRQRLAQYDVVIADTPGRRSGAGDAAWAPVLAALSPDEVHLVLHAGLRDDVVPRAFASYASLAPDHVLVAHADALPAGVDPAHVATLLKLPVKWLADSPELRTPLRVPAPPVEQPVARSFAAEPESLTLWQAHAIAGARLGVRR
jgi:flagellar biosynthesis protein FlhF